jgi:hypothetical protein
MISDGWTWTASRRRSTTLVGSAKFVHAAIGSVQASATSAGLKTAP